VFMEGSSSEGHDKSDTRGLYASFEENNIRFVWFMARQLRENY